jgi:YVTN family beta-propeller protein
MTLETGEVSPVIALGAQPERIALTPDGTHAYISNLGDGTMSVLDVAQAKITTTFMLGSLPFNPLVSADGQTLYVDVMLDNHIAVISTLSNEITRTIPVDSPNGLAFSLDNKSLYVTSAFAGTVEEISIDSGMTTKTLNVGGLPGHIGVSTAGDHAYFVRPDGTTVEVLDTKSWMTGAPITVQSGPSTVATCHPPRL